MHKYLNQLGIKSDSPCIFNTEEDDEQRNEFFFEERRKHHFDSRETWNLDYTSATWLYEHLQVYKEYAIKIIDLNYPTFDIPILYEIPHNELKYIENTSFPESYFGTCIVKKTLIEAIDIIIKYLENYLVNYDAYGDEEYKAYEYLKCAFQIYAIIITSLWW